MPDPLAAERYRDQARRLAAMAEETAFPEIRRKLLELVQEYTRMAEKAERRDGGEAGS